MKNLLFFLFLIPALAIHAQDTEKTALAFSPGVILQKEVFAEANILYGTVVSNKMMVGISGARVGVESNLKSGNEFTIAPKVGYEIAMTLVTMRASAVNYFHNGNSEFRLVPEVGLCIGGVVNLTYGYGIRFQKPEITDVSPHRLSLTFNINKTLLKAVSG